MAVTYVHSGDRIGAGAFGCVFKGRKANSRPTEVALKYLLGPADTADLDSEVEALERIGKHPYIVIFIEKIVFPTQRIVSKANLPSPHYCGSGRKPAASSSAAVLVFDLAASDLHAYIKSSKARRRQRSQLMGGGGGVTVTEVSR